MSCSLYFSSVVNWFKFFNIQSILPTPNSSSTPFFLLDRTYLSPISKASFIPFGGSSLKVGTSCLSSKEGSFVSLVIASLVFCIFLDKRKCFGVYLLTIFPSLPFGILFGFLF